jgi:hypothetical protein
MKKLKSARFEGYLRGMLAKRKCQPILGNADFDPIRLFRWRAKKSDISGQVSSPWPKTTIPYSVKVKSLYPMSAPFNSGSSPPSHWTKDFVEHLRTVHFSLVLVATILIVTGLNTDASRLTKALTQLQQIANFEKEWPSTPSRLYEQAVVDAKLDMGWINAVEFDFPKHFYNGPTLDTFMEINEQSVIEAKPWRFGGNRWPSKLSSLADFRDFWNMLNKGIILMLVKGPTKDSPCQALLRVENPDIHALIQTLGGTNFKCRIRAIELQNTDKNTSDISFNKLMEEPGTAFDYQFGETAKPETGTRKIGLWATSQRAISASQDVLKGKNTQKKIVAVIELNFVDSKIDERVLSRLFFSDWRQGNFDTAFSELNSVSSDIATLDIAKGVERLQAQAASAEKSISLLGFNIPITQLAQWGLLVLLSVQLYFWLHLHELTNRIEPDAEGWNVAWIGVYRTRVAETVGAISCFILPVIASIILAYRFNTIGFYHRRTVLAASCLIVMFSAGLGFLTIRRLIKLRQNLP